MAMYHPIGTYRLQFHKEFTFEKFEKIIAYLQQLGVSTIYASPVFEAVAGSTHGYDSLNPLRINPEIGTQPQLKQLSKQLQEVGIGWLQDIVPNHMAFHPANIWLMDVLEKGLQSVYASFFDITLSSQLYHGRLMAPFLGSSLADAINNGEIQIAYQNQRFVLNYFENAYPLNRRSYHRILQLHQPPSASVKQLLDQMETIKQLEDPKAYSEQWNEFLLQLAALMKNKPAKTFFENALKEINQSPELLQQIADEQEYRLCHWQETDYHINYRRFFTVNGLICLNIQDKEVFELHHQFIKSLINEGVFQGLRIDHIDGLYNPENYLKQLREMIGEEPYIVIEKILEPGEGLLQSWPVQGNTGYDFLSMVNNLFTNKNSEEAFAHFYENLTEDYTSIQQQIRDKKAYILYHHMAGELDNLFRLFKDLNLVEKKSFASIRQEDLKEAIAEFLIQCPVYRYYGNYFPLEEKEAAAVQHVINRVRQSDRNLRPAIALLETAFLHKPHERNEDYNQRVLRFYRRCMQFTGPLMAKGVEDTLMYTYNRFIGHNEVGDAPESFGLWPKDFHAAMLERKEFWPLSLNATATHDTKRGEDVRARLNVLTDLTDQWLQLVQEWQLLNAPLKQNGAPDANDEYFIYQTLMGTYPMPGEEENDFGNRLQAYLQKALREAKQHSNWTTPNEEYEDATKQFAVSVLKKDTDFWKSFSGFQQKVSEYGIVNSLAQVLLKFTCPGIPDVYQGCELWDFSFVDPDNRRAVDYEKRRQWMQELKEKSNDPKIFIEELWQNRHNAQIKLWLTQMLFNLRKQQPELFTQGEYLPLQIEGKYKNNVLAFARQHRRSLFVVAVPLHIAQLCEEQQKEVLEVDWKNTRIVLPDNVAADWEELLTSTKKEETKSLFIKDLFTHLPLAIWKGKLMDNERGAGILLHITSLASPFGIGDMGQEARAFADFLSRCNQKYWQLLPLNPTEEGQGHSPYSAISSRAGNPLLISPELLAKEGLLTQEDISSGFLPQEGKTNYAEAQSVKNNLFEKAFQAYCAGAAEHLQQPFEQFCQQEGVWLTDFASYMLLKHLYQGKPWYQWPEKYKLHQTKALEQLHHKHAQEVKKIKWLQFIFDKQYKELKAYCNERHIRLLGDLPFYVSYDSVDVWAHRDIFSLDKEGNPTGLAGVPPDAFSDDGQLWGMPVYRWEVLKERNYDWWVERFRRNQELFDLVRLDHFRAFADYWEVPAGEQTAKKGEWKPGPGADFFEAMEKQLGDLPFVAEDLGDINEAVFELRDHFNLPGMKVLHFAFGSDMPRSEYIPHNYKQNFIAYTGTHDNNTTKGWYRQDLNDEQRQNLEHYIGHQVSEHEIHSILSRMAYASIAKTVILPLQDVLGLDEAARMNIPSSANNNWAWRLYPGQIHADAENLLQKWVWLYNRE